MFRRLTRAGAIAATLVVAASLAPAASAADGTWGTFDVPSIGSIVVQPDGGILGTDCGNARIYRVSPAGAVSIFAGAGGGGFDNGYSGDGGPALDAHFGCVYGIIDDGAGGVLVADHLNDVIRRIDRRGIVSTVAGSGPRFTWSKGPWMPNLKEVGDGGPAQDALLDAPTGIALDGSGNTYIVDRDHDAVRRVGVDGTIVTVAGTGQGGYSGDGGPATQAKLNRPLGVLPLRGGAFLIADENNARVRRVDAAGRITTIAGTGRLGCGGDGGPATAASLQNVSNLALTGDGSLVVSQGECHRVRIIRPDGTIQPVLGTGEDRCGAVEGGLATSTPISGPYGVTLDASGRLLVADPGCQVVIRVNADGRVHIAADLNGLGG